MARVIYGTCGTVTAILKDGERYTPRRTSSFHGGGDTYRNQEQYVNASGNQHAQENFKATKPYLGE